MESSSVIKKVPQYNGSLFKRNPELFKHIVVVSDNPLKYECTVCNKTFASKSNCSYHKNCSNDSMKQYECPVCNRRFTAKSHFEYHKNSHEGVNPYPCSKCSKSFKSNSKLLRHEKVHAEERKSYQCNKCEKKFLGKTSLENHLRCHHEGVMPFHCYHCSKKFSEKKNLIHHLNSLNKIKNYVCEICGNSFVVKWNLELHRRTHFATRSFKCPVSGCSTTFLQKRYLNRHMELHKNTTKYECETCHLEFSRKDNLRRHFLRHLEEGEGNSPEQVVQLPKANVSSNKTVIQKSIFEKEGSKSHTFEATTNESVSEPEFHESCVENEEHGGKSKQGVCSAGIAPGVCRESVIKSVPSAMIHIQVSVIKDGRKETAKIRSSEVDSCFPHTPQYMLSDGCAIRNRSVIESPLSKNPCSNHQNKGVHDHMPSLLHNNIIERMLTSKPCFNRKKMMAATYMHGLCSDADVNPTDENRYNSTLTDFMQSDASPSLKCNNLLDLSMKSHEESFF